MTSYQVEENLLYNVELISVNFYKTACTDMADSNTKLASSTKETTAKIIVQVLVHANSKTVIIMMVNMIKT